MWVARAACVLAVGGARQLRGKRRRSVNRRVWMHRFGALSGVGIFMIPPILVYASTAKAPDFGRTLLALIVLSPGGHRVGGRLVFHFGSHVIFDLGLALAAVPGAVTIWLLAPLAEYRRRDALMTFLPVWNVYITAKICARVVDAAKPGFVTPAATPSTDTGLVPSQQ